MKRVDRTMGKKKGKKGKGKKGKNKPE